MKTILEKLLEARKSLQAHRNRRRLFTKFDEIFAGLNLADNSDLQINLPQVTRHSSFHFKRIRLENWKAFEVADFAFPATDSAKPIILIGGDNGHGKTSILDAIVAGLYGAKGLIEAERSLRDIEPENGSSRRGGYRAFLERALHKPAFERGARVASISLELETDQGSLEIERRWYFGEDGSLFEDDEELVLRSGPDRDILRVPEDEVASLYYQSHIHSILAPASMIPFFLFDGEHIRRLAKRDLSDQVRLGIESAVGVASLKGLIGDLQDYIRDRGRDLQADDVETAIGQEVASLESSLSKARSEVIRVESEVLPMRRRRDEIVHAIGGLSGGTFQDKHAAIEARHASEVKLTALRSELTSCAGKLLPFMLLRPQHLAETAGELEKLSSQPSHPAEGQADLEKLIVALSATQPVFEVDVESVIADRIRLAWAQILQPHHTDNLPSIHAYMAGHRGDRVIESLRKHALEANQTVPDLLERIAQLKADVAQSDAVITTSDQAEASRESYSKELQTLNSDIERLEILRRNADETVWKLESQLAPKTAEFARRQAQRRSAIPAVHIVDTAIAISTKIEYSIQQLVPEYYALLAERVTSIYRSLAHKGLVQSILIDQTGRVSLFDAKGRDLTDTDFSAGESQVFATSLIAAVSSLLGSPLPLVVDTPLGRLDPGHRERILEYFATRPAQTILLSQPEEVGGHYYEMLAGKISAEYHLSYSLEDGGLGSTTLERGYFTREAA